MRTVGAPRRFSTTGTSFRTSVQNQSRNTGAFRFAKEIESELRSAAPGGGCALRTSATVFREEIRGGKKKGKSDTLVELGVSVSVCQACAWKKPAAYTRTHMPPLPP